MTRYKYSCTSKVGGCLTGHTTFCRIVTYEERDILISAILTDIANIVTLAHLPWDPFNIELIVQAQNEPKPQGYTCPICGAIEKAHLCK